MKKLIPKGRRIETDLYEKVNTQYTDYDKVQSTLKQFVREWSDEGKEERSISYGTILSALQKYIPERFVFPY